MKSLVRPELPTASVGSRLATTDAVDNSAPMATHQQSTYTSGRVVQRSGAASPRRRPERLEDDVIRQFARIASKITARLSQTRLGNAGQPIACIRNTAYPA